MTVAPTVNSLGSTEQLQVALARALAEPPAQSPMMSTEQLRVALTQALAEPAPQSSQMPLDEVRSQLSVPNTSFSVATGQLQAHIHPEDDTAPEDSASQVPYVPSPRVDPAASHIQDVMDVLRAAHLAVTTGTAPLTRASLVLNQGDTYVTHDDIVWTWDANDRIPPRSSCHLLPALEFDTTRERPSSMPPVPSSDIPSMAATNVLPTAKPGPTRYQPMPDSQNRLMPTEPGQSSISTSNQIEDLMRSTDPPGATHSNMPDPTPHPPGVGEDPLDYWIICQIPRRAGGCQTTSRINSQSLFSERIKTLATSFSGGTGIGHIGCGRKSPLKGISKDILALATGHLMT